MSRTARALALVAPLGLSGCAAGLRFASPWWLPLLVLVPLLVWRYARGQRPALVLSTGGRLAHFARGWVARLAWLPAALRVVAVALLLVAVARPQLPSPELTRKEGIDIVIALDLSGSMGRSLGGRRPRLSDPPRLEVAKQVLREDLLQQRPNDRVALVVFGAEAYTRAPLTLDHELLDRMVADLRTDMFDQEFSSRTAIGDALGVSLNRLASAESRTRAVILLTDGVSNAGLARPEDAAKAAKEAGVRVYPVLIGQELGEEVDPQQLDDLAEITGTADEIAGPTDKKHYAAPDRAALREGLHRILDALDRAAIEAAGRESFREVGPTLGAWAFALLLIEWMLRLWRFRGVA